MALLFILFFAINPIPQGDMRADSVTATQLWQRGKDAASQGNYKKALTIWESAMDSPDSPDGDIRLAVDYIALATREHLRTYYQRASEMYLWGLSNCSDQRSDILHDEYERVKPILEKKAAKEWKKLVKKDPAKFCDKLSRFWKRLDPTITTDYNERLIEHWERIAYAQEHFKRGRETVYNTDDRALIYVKYGDPDRISKGILHFNYSQVQSWIQDVLDFQFHDSGITIPATNDTSEIRRLMIAQIQARLARIRYYTRMAEFAHKYPYYEIWVYRDLLPETREHLIYIFGDDGDTGEFRMQRSLEEMIPNSAFRGGSVNNNDPLTAGLLLQLLFYEQTSIADNYFASVYNDLQSRLLSPAGFHRYTSFEVKSQFEHKLSFLQFKAPSEKSTYLEEMPNINLTVYQYRLMDEKGKPYLATFMQSQPQKAFFVDLVTQSNRLSEAAKSYELYNYTMVVDNDDNILDKQHKPAPIFFQGTGNVDNMKKSEAYFRVPQLNEKTEEIFTVELHNRNTLSGVGEMAFSNNIRAIGRISEAQPEPLSVDDEKLEVGDLMVGIRSGASTSGEKGPTHFKVIHDQVIPEGKNLMVHLEVYHLKSENNTANKFEVNYKVSASSRNIFKRLFGGGKEKVGLTLNFETTGGNFKEDIEVATSPFEPGSYNLSLQVVEPLTGQKINRDIDFKIAGNRPK